MDRALVLYKKGLRQFHDIWDRSWNNFVEWKVAHIKFSLVKVFYVIWIKLLEHYASWRSTIISHLSMHFEPEPLVRT